MSESQIAIHHWHNLFFTPSVSHILVTLPPPTLPHKEYTVYNYTCMYTLGFVYIRQNHHQHHRHSCAESPVPCVQSASPLSMLPVAVPAALV